MINVAQLMSIIVALLLIVFVADKIFTDVQNSNECKVLGYKYYHALRIFDSEERAYCFNISKGNIGKKYYLEN